MANDSVREELEVKKFSSSTQKSAKNREIPQKPRKAEPETTKAKNNLPQITPLLQKNSKHASPKMTTMEIVVKNTEPTLVEFQSQRSTLPEWRLQIQNAIQQKAGIGNKLDSNGFVAQTVGATALKLQPQHQTETDTESSIHDNPTLCNALKRIAESRERFLVRETPRSEITPAETPDQTKNYPLRIAAKEGEILPVSKHVAVNYTVKPRHEATPKPESEKFDTNKLPPISEEVSKAFDIHKTSLDKETERAEKTELKLVENEEIVEEYEEIEDIAPLSMRFNAGLFDMIIGTFVSLILLAPFMLNGGWFTLSGFLAYVVVCAVVMFIYMTVAIGFYGTTLGMMVFSLEVVDIEGENYPTLHQAAVSSSLYLASIICCGAGFLTVPFNEERRAFHDIVSRTIVVKEI